MELALFIYDVGLIALILDEVAHSTAEPIDVQQTVLQKLEQISTKQDTILENQNTIIDTLNTLQAFSKKDDY